VQRGPSTRTKDETIARPSLLSHPFSMTTRPLFFKSLYLADDFYLFLDFFIQKILGASGDKP
jgi:hypothetical protein